VAFSLAIWKQTKQNKRRRRVNPRERNVEENFFSVPFASLLFARREIREVLGPSDANGSEQQESTTHTNRKRRDVSDAREYEGDAKTKKRRTNGGGRRIFEQLNNTRSGFAIEFGDGGKMNFMK
jgi:hypothetical protein